MRDPGLSLSTEEYVGPLLTASLPTTVKNEKSAFWTKMWIEKIPSSRIRIRLEIGIILCAILSCEMTVSDEMTLFVTVEKWTLRRGIRL